LIWETIRTSFIYLAIAALDFFILIVVISGWQHHDDGRAAPRWLRSISTTRRSTAVRWGLRLRDRLSYS
jgi:hypothetical protein